ncbi:YitT family protein [Macrococcus hajekii]|uniref:YitT family protein n=1 Tax=Macrococcus hajekii TaxID=198482 RepID=A0A4R6BJC3_9STAP|nr:YitT family protein [Macrococcus hajekii]TDM01795.1 YitT family protein [Macrococcus hajekii]GGB07540.1 putative membrane protein YczE [Macrococcus hajekii]
MYRGHYKVRWLFFVTGLTIMGAGIAMMLRGSQFGLSSWDVFHYGLWKNLGLSIGMWSIIIGLIIIFITFLLNREWPKIGVYVNMLTLGIFIDVFNHILPEVHGTFMQLVVYIIGVTILTFGIALYITPQLGAGPRDSFMMLLVERTPMDLKTARTFMEVVVMVAGYLLGGPVSVGTIIVTFAMGPLIQLWLPHTRQLLNRYAAEVDI